MFLDYQEYGLIFGFTRILYTLIFAFIDMNIYFTHPWTIHRHALTIKCVTLLTVSKILANVVIFV